MKTGELEDRSCPDAILTYREIMGGVDRSDQMATLYEPDRKSLKWWIKVFYRLLMMAVVNSWIIYKDNNKKDIPLIKYVIVLSEEMIKHDQKVTQKGKLAVSETEPIVERAGKRKKPMHIPTKIKQRRRCMQCSKKGIERRSTFVCGGCNTSPVLCVVDCFNEYHNNN